MPLQRSTFVGCTDYTGADLSDIVGHFKDWERNTKYTIEQLTNYRIEVEKNKERLDEPQDILNFIDLFIDALQRYSKDFDRLILEVPVSVEERHVEIVAQIAESSFGIERRCVRFKEIHIERPLKDETLRTRLIDRIYGDSRDQAIDYQDLSNVVSRLKTYVGTRTTAQKLSISDFDALELKPNIFGIGINVNHLIKKLAGWWKSRRGDHEAT